MKNWLKVLILGLGIFSFGAIALAGPKLESTGEVSGNLEYKEKKYYVGDTLIDIGDGKVKVDLNQDETENSLKEEIQALLGTPVEIKGLVDSKKTKKVIYVTSINQVEFLNSKVEREKEYQNLNNSAGSGGGMGRVNINKSPSIIEREN